MRLRVEPIREPDLLFGNGEVGKEPKLSLARKRPADPYIERLELGVVALPAQIEAVRAWFAQIHSLVLGTERNARRFREFPGVSRVFPCRYDIPDKFVRVIEPDEYSKAQALAPRDAFTALLDLFGERVESLFGDVRPSVVLVCIPEELAEFRISNPRLTERERAALERLQREEDDEQISLFAPSAEELRLVAELKPQAEELLFRSFYRALKARCMAHSNPVPIQVLRRHTYVPDEAVRSTQSDATRAWNLAVSLYYKSGRIPWRPYDLTPDTCFVGLSFHHLKRRSGDVVYASLAQAFSSETEPFALQGGTIPRSQTRGRQPYLTEEQASELAKRVIAAYKARTDSLPSRVVLHKTSRYQPEEQSGFRESLLAQVPACDLVWIAPTGFRLLRRGMQEPSRGTLCTVGDYDHYLFTTGFVPWWDEYPGPHIPAPLRIGIAGGGDIVERSREILALTKMNWNNAEGIGRHPITISFARKVGTILTEMPDDAVPNPLYRFYM